MCCRQEVRHAVDLGANIRFYDIKNPQADRLMDGKVDGLCL